MKRNRIAVAGLVAVVLSWRAAAYLAPSSFVEIAEPLRIPQTLLGLLFLACGVWAWWVRPNSWTSVLLVYGLGSGVHWGGAIGAAVPAHETAWFCLYLAWTAIGDAALLHLAALYPLKKRLASTWAALLYAPAAVALLLVPVALFAPSADLRPAVGIVLLIANVLSLTAGLVFLIKPFLVDRKTRRSAHLFPIAAGISCGSALALLGAAGVLPGLPEAWNLALGIVPVVLAAGLVFAGSTLSPGE